MDINYCTSGAKQRITVGDIQKALEQQPDCIPAWVQYSEDKRTNSGWFIRHEGAQMYTIGFFSKGIEFKYHDRTEAIANFIKFEIDELCKGSY